MGRNKMIYATELPELSMSGVVTKSDIVLSPTFESKMIHTLGSIQKKVLS
jgi:hypothetical protein